MEISKESVVNLEGNNEFVRVYAKQYDKESRRLILEFTHNGELWEIPSGTIARFAMTKPDGEQILNDAVVSGNTVEVELTYQMLSAAGNARCEVQLYDNGTKEMLSSAVFDLVVSRAAYSKDKVESSSEYQSFIHALLEIDVKLGEVEQATDDANKAAGMASTAADTANAAAKSANTAAGTANTAASAANSAAGTAQTQGNYAKTQGDYAKTQGDRAKSEADRLEGVDVAKLQDQIDGLKPNAKIKEYTSFEDLGLQNTATYEEIFNAMESPSIALLLKSTEEVPESPVSPTQPGFLVINKLSNSRSEWSFFIVGNGICEKYIGGYTTTITPNFTGWKKVISSSNVDITLNSTSEDPVQNKVLYNQFQMLEPKTQFTEYTSFEDLGLQNTATYEEIFSAMASPSIAMLSKSSQSVPETPISPTQAGTLVIRKLNSSRSDWFFYLGTNNGNMRFFCGLYSTSGFTGWKEITLGGSETGTWTPTITCATGETATLSLASGTYTTIGNMIFLECGFTCSSLAAIPQTSALSIGGLPFSLSSGLGFAANAYSFQDTNYGNAVTAITCIANGTQASMFSATPWDKTNDVGSIRPTLLNNDFRVDKMIIIGTLED